MKLEQCSVAGSYVVVPDVIEDERGFFTRVFSAVDFANAGLESTIGESSLSYNRRRHTIRGMHYQRAEHVEAKLVRCIRGALYDVVLDLREDSPTYLNWHGVELNAEDRLSVYAPPGVAHGYLTLDDETELLYDISKPYEATAAAGVRWDDPAFGIVWPARPQVIAPRDAGYPDYRRAPAGL